MNKRDVGHYCIIMPGILALGVALMLAVLPGCNRNFNLSSGDLKITLDQEANVIGLQVGQTNLQVAAAPLVSLCPVDKGQFYPARIVGGSLARGLKLDFGEARATANLKIVEHEGSIKFAIDLQGKNLPARGMLLRFSFPVDAIGWQWHDNISSNRVIGDKVYENVESVRYYPYYPDLPEWRDQSGLRMGYRNRNFCSAISGPDGLCLAVPLKPPCIFRTSYDGARKSFDITYDFALTPDSRKANAVCFSFNLYTFDPAWGLRAALEKYYRLYPEYFKVFAKVPGQWAAFSTPFSDIDNVDEFRFGSHWTTIDPAYDDKIGVPTTLYYLHAGMPGNFPPPYNPEKDPLPSYEEQVAAVDRSFKKGSSGLRGTGQDGMYEKVGTRNPDGKLDMKKWSVYGHLLAQYSLDPELPYGKFVLADSLKIIQEFREKRNADLDGFGYDDLPQGADYAVAHFRTSESPVFWDPINKKPFLDNYNASVKFAEAMAKEMRAMGKITIINNWSVKSCPIFLAPWLDMIGQEVELVGRGCYCSRDDLNNLRVALHHKPFLTVLKDRFEAVDRSQIESFMKRCLAYGVSPGFFDRMTSGLGPGGEYFDHPRYYERDRDLHKKYLSLYCALVSAGWEPVTHALSSNNKVYVERFGPTPDGALWLTLINEMKDVQKTTLTIDAKELGLDADELKAWDMMRDISLPLKASGDQSIGELSIPSGDVYILQIASSKAAAGWRIAQSLEALDRENAMQKVDMDKPAVPVYWRTRGIVGREKTGIKDNIVLASGSNLNTCLKLPWPATPAWKSVFTGGGVGALAMQWEMVLQTNAADLKLKARAAAENLPDDRSAAICCQVAWATRNFAYTTNEIFYFPPGTYDYRDFEFTINPGKPIHAIRTLPAIAAGLKDARLKIARISLVDAGGREYMLDGSFKEWYEPIPKEYCQTIDDGVADLRGKLVSLQKAAANLDSDEYKRILTRALEQIGKLRKTIADNKIENGCRRILRDLETINSHLEHIK